MSSTGTSSTPRRNSRSPAASSTRRNSSTTTAKHKTWFLQLECFDPHEPFFAAARFREGLETGYQGPVLDWPRYGRPSLDGLEARELRANYLALVRMCDLYLGRLLDRFDADDLWRDTALIVSTDHGLLLGEHEFWGKNRPPFFNEVAHIPLFIHYPGGAAAQGQRRRALTQTTDLMPTVLDAFGIAVPPEVRGASLLPVLHRDQAAREACIYGQFGGSVNVTDGRHSYFRYPAPDNGEQAFSLYADAHAHAQLLRAARAGRCHAGAADGLHQGHAGAAGAGGGGGQGQPDRPLSPARAR